MSRIEELIQKLCPNGVEWKKLGEVLDYEQPTKYIVKSTEYSEKYDVPVLTAGQSFILGYTNEREGLYKSSKDNPVIIFDDFTTSFHWVDFEFKIKSSAMKMLTPKYKNIKSFRYIYHCMKNIKYKNDDHTRQWIGKYSKFKIPFPPLEIQEEIVHILDSFTELTAELTAELIARRKQYEFYRDSLLGFSNRDDRFTMVKLGEICTVNQGLQIPINKRKLEPGQNRYFYITVQFLKNGDDKYYIENPPSNVICNEDDILVTRTGSTGKIITGVKGCFHNNFFKINLFEGINGRYLFYSLSSNEIYNKMLSVASGGTVPDLPHKAFYSIEIPLPSLSEQERIVSILDKFDSLCNDITQGLPAEIEARQKQYEYYRDKLLTFKDISEVEES